MKTTNNKYTLVLQCNNKYWSENDEMDIDHANKNCHVSQDALNAFFQQFNWRSIWDRNPNDSLLRGKLGDLVNKYKYEFNCEYSTYITDNNSFIEITVYTDAIGDHLQQILDGIENYVGSCKVGFGMWLEEIGFNDNGWNKFNAKNLVQCKHKKYTHLSFLQKGDDIVEICKCTSCGTNFHKIVESL